METKGGYYSTDVQLHSRHFRPTHNLERAIEKSVKSGSREFRVYGKPIFLLEVETGLIYLSIEFPKEIREKIKDGTLSFRKESPWHPDLETQEKLRNSEKKRAKESTRVWSKE